MSRTSKSIAAIVVGTLVPLAGVAGLATSTSTSLVTTTSTTSSTLPPACGPNDATFDSIRCRLDDLVARVAAADDLERFGKRLEKNLGRAENRLDRAEDACRDDNLRKSKRQLKRLVRVLVRAGRALTSLNARRKLDRELRRDLLGDIRALVRDAKRLRRVLVCPPASPSGAFV
jgi:hypothetical protein